MSSSSEIQTFYTGSTIFLTGGTGFLGKIVLEKLLRSCSDLEKIYLLMRIKKDAQPEERLDALFELPVFGPLKAALPDFRKKVFVLNGNIEEEEMGLSEKDKDVIRKEVDCVFHLAATVRFDEKIKKAVQKNVKPIKFLMEMAKGMKQLKSFVHVSTAYTNCNRRLIEEKCYEPRMSSEQLLKFVEATPDRVLDDLEGTLYGPYLNSYFLTKNAAENLVAREGKNLPVAIFRPSIVISSAKEPVPGWIDTYFGSTTILMLGGMGLMHVGHIDMDNRMDYVPVDYVSNAIIACGVEAGKKKRGGGDVPVYNYCAGEEAPTTMREISTSCEEAFKKFRSMVQYLPCFYIMFKNRFLYNIFAAVLHHWPCLLIDAYCKYIGKKPMASVMLRKMEAFYDNYNFFISTSFDFKTDNVQKMWLDLKPEDKKIFPFSMSGHDWKEYCVDYVRGMRVYLAKDPIETIPAATKRYKKICIIFYSTLAVLALLLCFLLKIVFDILLRY